MFSPVTRPVTLVVASASVRPAADSTGAVQLRTPEGVTVGIVDPLGAVPATRLTRRARSVTEAPATPRSRSRSARSPRRR